MSSYNEEYLDVAQLLSENSNDSNGINALIDSDTHDSSTMMAATSSGSHLDHDYDEDFDEEYEYRSKRRGKRTARVIEDAMIRFSFLQK